MIITEYPDRATLVQTLAAQMAKDLAKELATNETASLAVAGGTTPAPIFDSLAQMDLAWDRVQLMASDERWVPIDHERSNARMIQDRFVTGKAATVSFLPFFHDGMSPEEGATALSQDVKALEPLSMVLLGMGEDMHTASLFPGVPGLEQGLAPDADALVVMRPESQPEARISLSARVLNAAKTKHLAIFGEAKRDALVRADGMNPIDAPISAVMNALNVHWAP